MTSPRPALWLAGAACFIGGVLLLMNRMPIPGCLLLLSSPVCIGEAGRRTRRQREQSNYEQKYGSSREQMRRSIDVAAVNRMREKKGDVHAIRVARRQLPDVPFKEVVALVREL